MPLSITLENVTDLYQLGDYYNVPELIAQCVQAIKGFLDLDNCCYLIGVASDLKLNSLIDACEEYIAKNLINLLQSEYKDNFKALKVSE